MAAHRAGPFISVVIPNYNGAGIIGACLESLKRQKFADFEVLVVDNASRDDSLEVVRRLAPGAIILAQEKNQGFAGGVNAGIRAARGEWIAVLNNDTEVAENWLEEAAAAIRRHPDAAFLACRILDFDNHLFVYSAGDCFLRAGFGYRRGQELPDGPWYHQEREVFSACGCAAIFRKSVLENAGGYDEKLFAYLEDVDLGLRLQAAGFRGYFVPNAEVFHRGGATSGGEFSPLSVRLRTRNALLVFLQSLPARVFWRCLPAIAAGQAAWLLRVTIHGRLLDYMRGLAGVLPLVPASLESRRKLRPLWRKFPGRLWEAIQRSESMAREDFIPGNGAVNSVFLKWYFRLL
jgi:hypothetical protein